MRRRTAGDFLTPLESQLECNTEISKETPITCCKYGFIRKKIKKKKRKLLLISSIFLITVIADNIIIDNEMKNTPKSRNISSNAFQIKKLKFYLRHNFNGAFQLY